MKKYIPYILIAGLMIALFSKDKLKVIAFSVPIPSVAHQFDTIIKNAPIKEVVNTVKVIEYRNMPEAEREAAYADAVTTRTYENEFTDSIQTIKVFSEVEGKLKKQTVSYRTFERSLDVAVKSKYHVYGGVSVGITNIEASTLIQNRKGNMIQLSVVLGKNLKVGYYHKLW